MILAIDVGNSHIIVGCMDGADIRYICRMESLPKKTEYEYGVLLDQLLRFGGMDPRDIDGAIISSVVPTLTGTMRSAIRLLCGVRALVVGAGIKTGLNIKIDNPAQLGSDLVVGAVAGIHSYTPPLLIVDMGTATTFTAIGKDSCLLGGAIVPGVGLSLSALVSGTSQLPKVPIEAPRSCIGTNTIDCMKSGAVFGAASLIDGFADRIESELGCAVNVVATGALAKVIVPHCRRDIIQDDDLLLRGLALIYAKNKR